MNRCNFWGRARCAAAVALALSFLAHVATAQTGPTRQNVTADDGTVLALRTFPANAVRGTLEVQTPPEVLLDGKTDRLSPGSRIRGPNGMLVLSAALAGHKLPVVYLREPGGMVHEVWVLTEPEAQQMPIKPSYSR